MACQFLANKSYAINMDTMTVYIWSPWWFINQKAIIIIFFFTFQVDERSPSVTHASCDNGDVAGSSGAQARRPSYIDETRTPTIPRAGSYVAARSPSISEEAKVQDGHGVCLYMSYYYYNHDNQFRYTINSTVHTHC